MKNFDPFYPKSTNSYPVKYFLIHSNHTSLFQSLASVLPLAKISHLVLPPTLGSLPALLFTELG